MNLKSLGVGVFIGLTLGVIVGSWFGEDDGGSAGGLPDPEPGRAAVVEPAADDGSSVRRRETGDDTVHEADASLSSDGSIVDAAVPWPAELWAELDLERKDDAWAYYMEQALLHYLAAHPSISQFDISAIECRMTRCLIEVTGYDENTVPVWQQVMYDISEQPWSEFGQRATSSGIVEGRVTIVGTLTRTATPD